MLRRSKDSTHIKYLEQSLAPPKPEECHHYLHVVNRGPVQQAVVAAAVHLRLGVLPYLPVIWISDYNCRQALHIHPNPSLPGSEFPPHPRFLLFPALFGMDFLFPWHPTACIQEGSLKIQVSSNKCSSMITIHIPFLFPQKFPLSPILLPPTPSPYIKPLIQGSRTTPLLSRALALRGMSGCPTPSFLESVGVPFSHNRILTQATSIPFA